MLQDDNDRVLLKKIADGDEEALCDLFDLYSKRMYVYACRITDDPANAQDVIQETFITIWKKASTFRNEGHVIAWMFSIVHHKALNARRSSAKYSKKEDIEQLTSESRLLPEIQEKKEEYSRLRRSLQHLSKDHREVLELVFYQGFSLAETAEICKCPIGTVKSRLSYAKAFLRGELTREGLVD